MSERSGFFNSVNGDRIYKAEDFAEYFNSLITNGIFPNPSTNLQVIANNDMTVTLKTGKAWINGYIYINDSDKAMNINVADGVLNRIDRVVIQFDKTNREIKAVVKKGQFATNPVAPEIIRNVDYYELGIADIYIGKGITSINQSNVTDLRLDNTYCGLVNSLIQADVTTLYNQYSQGFEIKRQEFEQAFNSWFTNIQNILDENTAGNLFNLINEKAQASHTHTKANITDFTHTHSINEITNLFSNIPRTVKIEKSNKDSNEIYTQVDYKREDGTLYMRSVLSGGTSPQYTTRSITVYDTDGATVLQTITHTLTYDSDGNLVSEL